MGVIKENLLLTNLTLSLFKRIMQASFVSDSLANLTVGACEALNPKEHTHAIW